MCVTTTNLYASEVTLDNTITSKAMDERVEIGWSLCDGSQQSLAVLWRLPLSIGDERYITAHGK